MTQSLSFTFRNFIFRGTLFDATSTCVNRAVRMSSEVDLIAKTTTYFTTWNCHDIARLRTLFSTYIELHDWNLRVTGKEEVIKANADIFDAFPNVSIDIVDTLVCVSKRAVTCESIVHLNDAANATLIVVDVLRFNKESEISSAFERTSCDVLTETVNVTNAH